MGREIKADHGLTPVREHARLVAAVPGQALLELGEVLGGAPPASSGVTSRVIVTYPRVKIGRPEPVPAATSISNVWLARPPGRSGVNRPISDA